MQRQSLGSPGRGGGGLVIIAKDDTVSTSDDQIRRESSPSSLTGDDDEIKPAKPLRRCHSPPEKFIHCIPILILISFLILYLFSHDPSPKGISIFFIPLVPASIFIYCNHIHETNISTAFSFLLNVDLAQFPGFTNPEKIIGNIFILLRLYLIIVNYLY